jgi:myo-inositol-1(or 4)-monophosphatase
MIRNPFHFSVDLAHQAGDLLLGYYQGAGSQPSLKADRTVVTEADLAADHLIAESIHREYSGEAVLSEELQPSLGDEEFDAIWVIDPLDGTTNFSLGLPFWGVSIARLVGGWPEIGVLYFPVLNELYTSARNRGAQFNQTSLHIKIPDPNIPATFFSCCSRTFRNYEVAIPYKPRILGSAAYSFCCVARNMALIAFEATPKIWDIAATWLLVSEAGGAVAPLNGSVPFPVQGGKDYSQNYFPTLAAANPEVIEKARSMIRPKSG